MRKRAILTRRVILLIMGLATQMIAWPTDFIEGLRRAGFASFSTTTAIPGCRAICAGRPAPSPVLAMIGARLGLPVRIAYTLKDMAADAVGLLDGLGIAAAHVVGVSMAA